MRTLMAFSAKRDQVDLCVLTEGAPPSHVVNIEILRASAMLTPPSIAFQDFSTQLRVEFWRHLNSRSFLQSAIIRSPAGPRQRVNKHWLRSLQGFVPIRLLLKQRPPENRRKSFQVNNLEICRCRA
jgi:hypothetical protein